MTGNATLNRDLSRAIFSALLSDLYAVDPLYRRHMRWVMNSDWLAVIKKVGDDHGPYWEDRATLLFGLPFTVTDGGGAPHLEPQP
jgi:predicted phage gp36 major capsid-like protein